MTGSAVFVDGVPLSRDSADRDGWDYADATHTSISVSGRLRESTSGVAQAVTVAFTCLDV